EMVVMYEKQVRPRLLALGLGGGVLVQRKINTFGAGESAVEEKLFDLTRRDHVPEVGITVGDATISLRILARAATPAEAQAQIEGKGAVSAEVAEAMAVGCRTRLRTDLAVSTVGVAGPGDLGPDKPAGTVFVGLAWEGGSASAGHSWTGARAEVQRRTAKM